MLHDRKRNILQGAITASLALLILVASIMLYNYKKSYKPPAFEVSAVQGEPQVDPEHGYSTMALSDAFRVTMCGAPPGTANSLDLYLTNEKTNKFYLLFQVYSAGELVAQTGLVKPGEYVKTIELMKPLQPGDNEIDIKAMALLYDSYYSGGTLNLRVTATVK